MYAVRLWSVRHAKGLNRFYKAFERALAADRPSIIHVKTDAEAITSRITLTKLREQALAKHRN